MPSPKKSSPKKSSPKKSSPKKYSSKSVSGSKPKMTNNHKAIAAASLLALLGGGYAAYRNRDAIGAAAGRAKTAIFASPKAAADWIKAQPARIKTAIANFKFTSLWKGKAAAEEQLNATPGVTPLVATAIKSAVKAEAGMPNSI